MVQCSDGFDISMYDLKMRGPGEVLGERQSGLPTFLVGDVFKDFPILSAARDDACLLLERYEKEGLYTKIFDEIQNNLNLNNEYVD